MKRDTTRTTREALGCFLMLVFAAITCMGGLSITLLAISQRQVADQPPRWWSVLIWVVAPGACLALVWCLTFGFKSLTSRNERK
jgi:TRAP-type C4-dicarboxylate transport system permease small subunit